MSCFVMSDNTLAALADTLERVLNSGFNRFGFSAPDSLYKALDDCWNKYGFYSSDLIFKRLYDLNGRAYNGRYKDKASLLEIPEMPEGITLVQPRERENGHERLLPWHYQFAKSLDCLIYQASEDATRSDPLFLALIDLSRIYKAFLVENTDGYSNALWG